MPTIYCYVNAQIYAKIERYANLWDKSIGKTAALIIAKGIEALEREEKAWQRRGVIASSTKTT